MLTIALNRGRILAECLPLLAQAGVRPAEDVNDSRKLIFETDDGNARLLICRHHGPRTGHSNHPAGTAASYLRLEVVRPIVCGDQWPR